MSEVHKVLPVSYLSVLDWNNPFLIETVCESIMVAENQFTDKLLLCQFLHNNVKSCLIYGYLTQFWF